MKTLLAEIEHGGQSHIGPVREDNQDAIRLPDSRSIDERGALYAVADGMGGHANGQLASHMALDKLFEAFYSHKPAAALKKLRRSVEMANLSVYQAAQRLRMGHMGTTLTAANVVGNKVYLAHVGDSRAYLVREGRAKCLTSDHTMVGDLVRMRVVTPDKVRTHAQRSILTKAVGLGMFVQPELVQLTLRPDDRLILCSDGVWSVVEDGDIAALAATIKGAFSLSQGLIDLALERQTDDNASVIAIHIQNLSLTPAPGNSRHWRWSGLLNGVLGHFLRDRMLEANVV